MKALLKITLLIISITLFACGGGGGGDNPTPTPTPTPTTPTTPTTPSSIPKLSILYGSTSGSTVTYKLLLSNTSKVAIASIDLDILFNSSVFSAVTAVTPVTQVNKPSKVLTQAITGDGKLHLVFYDQPETTMIDGDLAELNFTLNPVQSATAPTIANQHAVDKDENNISIQ